jgi:hypothetical protein
MKLVYRDRKKVLVPNDAAADTFHIGLKKFAWVGGTLKLDQIYDADEFLL